MSDVKLTVPLSESDVRALSAGDTVYLTGTIYTARDAAHKYLLEGGEVPFSLNGGVLYHCGPVVRKKDNGWEMVAAGPTTSGRLSLLTPAVLEKFGVRAVIGKGGMDLKTLQAMQDFGAVYLSAVGGAAAVLARAVRAITAVYKLEEFGTPEAFWELDVVNFPAIVTMDAHGNSIHRDVLEESRKVYERLIAQ